MRALMATTRSSLRPAKITPLERARRAKGLSMKQLGELAGVGHRTIGKLEAGHLPQLRTAFKLAEALECSFADLFDPEQEEAAS